jgi:hypothetical protein
VLFVFDLNELLPQPSFAFEKMIKSKLHKDQSNVATLDNCDGHILNLVDDN